MALEITVTGEGNFKEVTDLARSTGAVARHGLLSDQPVMWNRSGNYFYQFADPHDYDSVVEFHDAELEAKAREDDEARQAGANAPPRPTSADPAPPEVIPDTEEAIAVCLSPDVCRSPTTPVPYMSWGKACDDTNYSPDVRSNGLLIKRADSQFSCCYGDEPGTGLGVKSGTVGDIVEPVTSSSIVRANGIWVQRHNDRCTLNHGNTIGEYVYVKSTQTDAAPDATDEDDRNVAQKGWDGFYQNSGEAQAMGSALNRAGEYFGDPSLIGQDVQSGIDAIPSWDEAQQWGSDVAAGVGHKAQEVWNDPGGAANDTWNWGKETLGDVWGGVTEAHEEGGVAQAGGHLAAAVVSAINPFKKAKMAGEVADELGDVGDAARRISPDGSPGTRNDGESADGEGGVRSTRVPRKDVECFNKPDRLSDQEFDKQLSEQQEAINNMTAEMLLARRQAIRDAGGTSPLRDLAAQSGARAAYENQRLFELSKQGIRGKLARDTVAGELATLAATHRLDIIAGGDPRDISGMGDRSVNSSLGAQWKGRRSQSLEDYAADLKANGMANEKLDVTLRRC